MPPVDWGLLTALAALITALGGAIGGFLQGKHDGASISRQAVESAQTFWRVTLDEQNERLAEQGRRIAELEADKAIRDQERAEAARAADRLEMHLVSLHDWIDRGAKPPPPRRPAWLRPGPFSPLTTTNQPQPEE